jgi:hypothetical protein
MRVENRKSRHGKRSGVGAMRELATCRQISPPCGPRQTGRTALW